MALRSWRPRHIALLWGAALLAWALLPAAARTVQRWTTPSAPPAGGDYLTTTSATTVALPLGLTALALLLPAAALIVTLLWLRGRGAQG